MSTSATSSVSSMLNSRLRVSGLSSGIDYESMIQKLMSVEMQRVDKVKQDKQVLSWQKDSYRDVTNLLQGLKSKYFDPLSATNLRTSTAFNKTVSAVSDPSVMQVTGSTVGNAAHTVTVNTVATVGATAGTAMTLPFDPSTTTMDSFTGAAAGTNVLTIGTATPLNYTFTAGETINDFMTQVNTDPANTTYRISYDSTGSRFILTTKNTGANTVTASGTFVQSAGFGAAPVTATGANASYSIDGIAYTSTTNTYTSPDGLTFNFIKAGTTNVSTTRDIDGIVKNIENFVNDYNNIISTVNTKLSEKRYRDYLPLTDDQKSNMKDSDITLWEDKAKSGLLNNDSMLSGLVSRLRSAVYDQINLSGATPPTDTMANIGISTTSYLDNGKLTVDETKLRAALTANPDRVAAMFTQQSTTAYSPDNTSDQSTKRYNENGTLFRLDDILNDYVRTTRNAAGQKGFLLEKAGIINDITDYNNTMQNLINEKDLAITDLTNKLQDKQDAYYRQFSAMETALNNMNSQSSWISQQFGGGSSK